MTIRRPRPDKPPVETPGDFSSPINMAISPSGAIVQPDALTVINRALVGADIFAGVLYLGTFSITPALVKQAGNGMGVIWASSVWTCTASGNAQFQVVIQSPSGTNEIVLVTPAANYAAGAPGGPDYSIIAFAANAIPISRMVAGNWPFTISKAAGTATMVPNALGAAEKGNVVFATLG